MFIVINDNQRYQLVKCVRGKGIYAYATGEIEHGDEINGDIPIVTASHKLDLSTLFGVFPCEHPRVISKPRYRFANRVFKNPPAAGSVAS